MSKETLASALGSMLADSYLLYLKTQNYHWNVTGPRFQELHTLFETQYTDLQAAVDEIAERIRAIGFAAPGSFVAFSQLATIEEAGNNTPDANQMVRNLAEDQAIISKTASKVLALAQEQGDEVTADLMIQRLTIHEKNAWMLNSSLEGAPAAIRTEAA